MSHHDIVISYRRKNKRVMRWVVAQLQTWKVVPWYDRDKMELGIWKEQIKRAIRDCPALLVIWSKDYSASEICAWEFQLASESGKIIIPLWFEDCEIPEGFEGLGDHHRIDYFDGNDFKNNEDFVRILKKAGLVGRMVDAYVSDIDELPPIRPVGDSEHDGKRRIETKSEQPEPELEEAGAELPDLIKLVGIDRSPGVAEFFAITGNTQRDEELATAQIGFAELSEPARLLGEKKFTEAAESAGELLKTEFSFEGLRLTIVANILCAVQFKKESPIWANRAVMAVQALKHSPDLWPRWELAPSHDPEILMAECLSALDSLIEDICGPLADELGGTEETAGMSILEFVEAEEKSAACLKSAGGIPLETEPNFFIEAAFGSRFAEVFGGGRNLSGQAAEGIRERGDRRNSRWFSELFPFVLRFERGEYEELLLHPPPWVDNPEDNRFAEAVEFVADVALAAMRDGLTLKRIPQCPSRAERGLDSLISLCKSHPNFHKTISNSLLGVLLDVTKEVEEGRPTPWEAQKLNFIFSEAESRFPKIAGVYERLVRALCRHRARFSLANGRFSEALCILDDWERDGAEIKMDDLEVRICAALSLHDQDPKALGIASDSIDRMENEFPQCDRLDQFRSELELKKKWISVRDGVGSAPEAASAPLVNEIEQSRISIEGASDYAKSRKTYHEDKSLGALIRLRTAISLEAGRLMKDEGVDAVVRQLESIRAEFPNDPKLASLPQDLTEEFLGRFPADQINRLLMSPFAGGDTVQRMKVEEPHAREENSAPPPDTNQLLKQPNSSGEKIDSYFAKYHPEKDDHKK